MDKLQVLKLMLNMYDFQLRLKDKHCGDEFVHEFEDGTKRMEQYIKVARFAMAYMERIREKVSKAVDAFTSTRWCLSFTQTLRQWKGR